MKRTVVSITALAMVLLTSGRVSAEGKLSKEQIYSLFSGANAAFRQANAAKDDAEQQRLYERAILSFEKIINEGQIRNAKLYYNLGNAYFLKEDLGRAILNYRRAEKLDEGDADIRKNLSFARGRRVDNVPVKTEERVLQTLFFWHYDFSLRTKFVIAVVAFGLMCLGMAVMVWRGSMAPVTVVAVVCGILTVCFAASVVVEISDSAGKVCGVITAEEVVAHQADWENSAKSFKEPLHGGTEFDVIELRTGWIHIRLADGSDGWIPQSSAEII